MRIDSRCGSWFLAVFFMVFASAHARAAVVTSFEFAGTQSLPGFTSYNLFVDSGSFDWTNSSIEVTLSSGSLNHVLGGGNQPVAQVLSSSDSGVSAPSGLLGIASHIETPTSLDTAWFNTASTDTGKNQIGLITISSDANGTISGRSISLETINGTTFDFTITNGVIDGVVIPSLAGDYDGSGDVGQGDLDLVLNFWGASVLDGQAPAGAATWVNADDVTASVIGQDELALVLRNWGSTAAIAAELGAISDATGLSGDEIAGLIPEPATAGLLFFGGLVLLRRR